MSELGWFLIFIVFILIIVLLWWAFSGTTPANNPSQVGVVYQPGVGYVQSGVGVAGGGSTWSSGMIIAAVIVFFIIIAIIVWAVYPRRPTVVLPPPVGPMITPVPMPMPSQQPIIQNHYHSYAAEPSMYVPPEPIVAPISPPNVAPVMQQQYQPGYGGAPMANGYTSGGLPVARSVSVQGGATSFDPDPRYTQTVVPGSNVHTPAYHSQLGAVTGTLHTDPEVVTRVSDVGNHPVQVTGYAPGAVGARPIGAGNPTGARYAAPRMMYGR